MERGLENIDDLREEVLAKERALKDTQDLLLEQACDLRSCFDRVSDLEKTMLANSPLSESSDGDASASLASSEVRHKKKKGDTRKIKQQQNAFAAPGTGGDGRGTAVVASTVNLLPPSSGRPLLQTHDGIGTSPSLLSSLASWELCQSEQHRRANSTYPENSKVRRVSSRDDVDWQGDEVGLKRQPRLPPGRSQTTLRPASAPVMRTSDAVAAFQLLGKCPHKHPPQQATAHTKELDGARAKCGKYKKGIDRCHDQHIVHERKQEWGEECSSYVQAGHDSSSAHVERRAEAAEAAARLAKHEAKTAKDEVERLRRESAELSIWRDAVLDMRDALELAEQDGARRDQGRGDVSDDPITRHAQWVSSPALGTLMPHLQQRARELLSELTAARARVLTPAVSETEQTRAPDHQEVEHRRVATASATSMNDGDGDTRETTSSLRRECETLRIVAQALREKDEDSQRQITALQEEVFQASLTAVRQDAMISTLRRQLAIRGPYTVDDTIGNGGGIEDGKVEASHTCCGGVAGEVLVSTLVPTAPTFSRVSTKRKNELVVQPSLHRPQSSKQWPSSTWMGSSAAQNYSGFSNCDGYHSGSPRRISGIEMVQTSERRPLVNIPETIADRHKEGDKTLHGQEVCDGEKVCAGQGHDFRLKYDPTRSRDSRHGRNVSATSLRGQRDRRGCGGIGCGTHRQSREGANKEDAHVCQNDRRAITDVSRVLSNEKLTWGHPPGNGGLVYQSGHRSQSRRRLVSDKVFAPAEVCLEERRRQSYAAQLSDSEIRGEDITKIGSNNYDAVNSANWHGVMPTSVTGLAGSNGACREHCIKAARCLDRSQRPKSLNVFCQRLVQARRDLSSLRNGISTEELTA